jgi:hypothetical protein
MKTIKKIKVSDYDTMQAAKDAVGLCVMVALGVLLTFIMFLA